MGDLDPLKFWLESILLSEYYENFVQCGITTQEICANLDEGLLINLGVSLQGHRRRILNHLPTLDSGRWIHSVAGNRSKMEDAVPSIPPKTKSVRDSFLYQGDTPYQNLDDYGAAGESCTPSPRPVPQPRRRSNVKTSPSTGDPKPQPMKRPTPAPRKTPRASEVRSPGGASSPGGDKCAENADPNKIARNPQAGSVKILGVCTSETSTDPTENPPPCYQTGDSSQAQYNLFANTPDTNHSEHDDTTEEATDLPTQTAETKDFKTIRNDLQTGHVDDNTEYSVVHKGRNDVKKQESFENASFDSSSNTYVLKGNEIRDFDPLAKTDDAGLGGQESKTHGADVGACGGSGDLTNDTPDDDTDQTYEPIWMPPKKHLLPVNTQNRASNLMMFTPSPKNEVDFNSEFTQLRIGQIKGGKNRESFNMPHPTHAPPPLPPSLVTSTEVVSDFDPLTEEPAMPHIPPRPNNYVKKSASFKTYENLPFDLTGQSITMPSDSNMEPEDLISPQPIAHAGAQGSITTDPFKNKDPFGDFTPDTAGFDDHITSNSPGKPYQNDTNAVYAMAEEVPVKSSGGGGVIYEMAADPSDFDPFGLRSKHPMPRTISNASGGSVGSPNLDMVPPPPSWDQRVPMSSHVMGNTAACNTEEDSSSVGSNEDILGDVESVGQEEPMNMSPVDILPSSALSPRKRERSGYLYKQGGIKQNKGWKKRWVIFDGKSLRYYANSKTQVSKRIVPLSCMKNVAMDVKARPLSRIMNSADIFAISSKRASRRTSDSTTPPNNSRQFKFKLECNNRVFLFATDSLDDCKMWSSTLMEAIIHYEKPKGGENHGGEMANPDIEGWIKINKNRLKFYVTLKDHKLCYYQSIDDYNMASPLHEIDMKLSAVKEVERTKLQLSTHYSQFMLHFESSSDASNWKIAIEEAITDALGDNTILDQVKENPDNIRCADCGHRESHWASMNLGIVLCVKCAGIHRSFDYKMSKIRSLRMDTKVWNSSLIEVFKEIGNKNANDFWIPHQVAGQGIDDTTPPAQRKDYIFRKYLEKQWCDVHPLHSDHAALNEALLAAASTSDVLLTMKILLSGAEVLYTRPGEPDRTAYEVAKDARQRIQMEFLLQNGGDRTQNFTPGSEEASLVAKLRAEVQLQGYLLKTGSNMKDFLRRWVVLEHGHISYYDSEESKVENDRIDNDAILSMQATSTERHQFCFEISTKKGNNRVFLFSAVSDEERMQWMRYIAQIFCPVNLMDQMKRKDFSFVGYSYMKTGFSKEWQRTWYVLEQRKLLFTDKEQQEREEDSLDLRKVTNITKITDKALDACDTCLEQGPQFVLNAPDKALYLQCDLTRDTEKMLGILEVAIKKGGDVLEDQPLDSMDVPVIISQCINFIQLHGQRTRGIYREAAQDSKIKNLLERFREDARAVVLRLEDHTVHEVCNVLKRFLRNLSDPLLTSHLYNRWIQTASESDHNMKLQWYKYLLQQLPRVNYLTLLSLANHLHKLSEHCSENSMTLDNISISFGSTLMKSSSQAGALNPNSIGNAMQMEMKVISDIITYYIWLFDLEEAGAKLQSVEEQMRLAEERLKALEEGKCIAQPDDLMIYVYYMDTRGKQESIKVNKETTASDVIKSLVSKLKLPTNIWCLHETIKEELERPLHAQAKLWPLVTEWQNWKEEYRTSVSLVLKNKRLKESIEKSYDPCKPLFAEMKFAEKKKFSKMAFEFTQSKLACYKDMKNVNNPTGCWNIEDLSVYKGCDTSKERSKPPTKWTFSFICKGDKVGEKDLPLFGRAVCCNSEQELLCWLGGMMMAQVLQTTHQDLLSIRIPVYKKRDILGICAIQVGLTACAVGKVQTEMIEVTFQIAEGTTELMEMY